jgi:hypothetical protein
MAPSFFLTPDRPGSIANRDPACMYQPFRVQKMRSFCSKKVKNVSAFLHAYYLILRLKGNIIVHICTPNERIREKDFRTGAKKRL